MSAAAQHAAAVAAHHAAAAQHAARIAGGRAAAAGAGGGGGASRGIWPPEDDFRLVVNIQQVSDVVVVHRAVKFSKPYSLKEIKERWFALLYNPEFSRLSTAALTSLDEEERLMLGKACSKLSLSLSLSLSI